jgi:hypothetical protein
MPVRLGPTAETIAEGAEIRRQSRMRFGKALVSRRGDRPTN